MPGPAIAKRCGFCSNQASSSSRVGLAQGGHILGEKLHLLRHAALHDGVVLVQAERQRLAVEDLLADLALHEAGASPRAWADAATAPSTPRPAGGGRRPSARSGWDSSGSNRIGAQRAIHGEQHQPEQQEM